MNQRLELLLDQHKVIGHYRDLIRRYLDLLELRSQLTWDHSLRVGQLAVVIASWRGVRGFNLERVFQSGLLHDIGKSLIDPAVLRKMGEEQWTDSDREEMDHHPEYGWRLLRGVDEFLAAVIVRHHRFGPRPYPADIPPLPAVLIPREGDIELFAETIALADTFDALMTRAESEGLSFEARRIKYRELNPGQEGLIECLENEKVLAFQK